MGNNESLPPPPPPGPPPHVPPTPPVSPPAYTPPAQYPPTQQMPPAQQFPPTQQMPPTQQYPGGPPGGYPPQGYAPGPPPEPPKKKTGLIIGGLVAAAAVAAGVVFFTGGDDKKSTTLGGDDTSDITIDGASTTFTTTQDTVVVSTLATEATLVITLPPSTIAPPTTADTGVQTVADDTGAFTVVLPSEFATDTAPIAGDTVTFSHVSGSADLNAYAADNDTFGISILAAKADQVGTADDLMNQLDPGVDVCTTRTPQPGTPTALGAASVLLLDGCGSDGTFAKVIMAIAVPEKNAVLVAISQGFGPSNDTLLTFTQAVFESVRAL